MSNMHAKYPNWGLYSTSFQDYLLRAPDSETKRKAVEETDAMLAFCRQLIGVMDEVGLDVEKTKTMFESGTP